MNFFVKSNARDIFTALMAVILVTAAVASMSSSGVISGIAFSIAYTVMSFWFASIASAADTRLPTDLRLNAQTVRNVSMVSNVAAVVLFVAIIPNVPAVTDKNSDFPVMLPFPIGILVIGGLIYLAVLASKQLVTYERRRPVGFAEYGSTFLLLWFWYAGIWSLQPRIQRLTK